MYSTIELKRTNLVRGLNIVVPLDVSSVDIDMQFVFAPRIPHVSALMRNEK